MNVDSLKRIIPFVLAIFVFSSCKVLFTEQIRKQAEANRIDFSKIQFYNSDKIVLKRTLSSNEVSVASGKVIVENGKYTEIIKIKKNTRGICTYNANNSLNISFEAGPDRGLAFKNNGFLSSGYYLNPDNCKTEKISSIAISSSNKKRYVPIESVEKKINKCSVIYDGKTYSLELPSMPYLLIKKAKFYKNQTKKRTLKGLKVD